LILVTTGVLLAFELLPAPRPLFAADVPHVYRTIATDPRPVRVLDLPFGIRDGLGTVGNFDPASQYYQTLHHKSIIGGYLSRVPQSDRDEYLAIPMIKVITALSENRQPPQADFDAARASARQFLERSRIGYVVIDDRTTPQALRDFVMSAMKLVRVDSSPGYELFAPAVAPLRHAHRGL
jgi:hypothetical protein